MCSLSVLAAACSPAATPGATSAATSAPAAARTSTPAPTPTAAPTLARTGKVTMGDNYFAPDEVTVAVGATVTWEIVAGDAKHDVVASDGSFRSNSPMSRGDLFTFTFTKPGEYAYICSFHTVEHMTGKIVVK
ncbi:MAG TPA: cupredoxin domain-containing protein [Methylomirabilota bacterium]|nr:cupredoxin domain-containing protein [Methylomirabilota bacterium]